MIRINDEIFYLKDHNTYDIDLTDLTEVARNLYYRNYEYYNYMFYIFLIHNTNIKQIDNEFIKSSLKYISITESQQDFYQLISCELKYFYIRNNLYIQRLSKDESGFIMSRINNNNYAYDSEVEQFIKNTFKKVISEGDGYINFYNFGPTHLDYSAPVDSLIIGFRNDDFENGQAFTADEIRNLAITYNPDTTIEDIQNAAASISLEDVMTRHKDIVK